MITFPHAKINLGLHITERRADGYHNLETCFYPLPTLCDSLELIPVEKGRANLSIYGMDWNEPKEKNLIWKAWSKFREFESNCPDFHWHLLKKIPTGGGLGGGSSDAAFALRMLAEFCGWNRHDSRLQEMAAELGSDCAFFLHDQPMMGTGRGEVLSPVSVSLQGYRIEWVTPAIHVSTRDAFSKVVPKRPERSISEILALPVENWKGLLVNDFEESVFTVYPELAKVKRALYEKGAVYSSLSGSGSTLYGLFKED